MTKLSQLKKDLKNTQKDIKKNKNLEINKELAESLQTEIKIKENLRAKGYKTKIFNKIEKKFEEYDPKIKLLDGVKYIGHKIVRYRFDRNQYNGNSFSIKEVQKISNDLSGYLQDKGINGKIMTSMDYGPLDWRSGKFSDIGSDVRLYSPADSNIELKKIPKIKSFVIYNVINPKPIGGNDIYNDCLYNCMNQMIPNLKDFFENPEEFKTYLGLKRCDKVHIDKIDKIEQKLRTFQINIRGDYIHQSIIKSEKVINLTLINQHYSIDKSIGKKKTICKNISYQEKPIILYDKFTFEIYDGKEKRIISKEDRNFYQYDFKSPYTLIERELQRDEDGQIILISIEEEYHKLIPIVDKLKQESNGMINLYKSGSYKNAALDLFDRFNKSLNEPEEILQDEAMWIKESSIGALIWAEEYEGELYKYDIKSQYPYLMKQSTLKFPIKRGDFLKIEKFGEFFQFGIYRCKISKSTDENINKLFRFNDSNYYTSISLEHAKTIGLKYELIQDSQPNFLYYSRDKLITFNEVFKSYVDLLFSLKEKKVEKAKNILNILWGALCEIEKKKYYCDVNKIIDILDDEEIFEIRPYKANEDIDIISTHKTYKRYKTNYARLLPFLVSKGRDLISKIMFPIKENIKRIQTDGFLSTIKLHENIDVKLGELKYEGYTESGHIQNCINKVKVYYTKP
jgi:hypothetical protein